MALMAGQLIEAGAWSLVWLFVERGLTGPLLSLAFGRDLWSSRTPEQRHLCGLSLTSGVFAVVSVAFGLTGMLFPSPGIVADPIYGHSDLVQLAAGCMVGFFFWNALAENARGWAGWSKLIHHLCCLFAFLFAQHGFSGAVACSLMMFEASTIPLCAFNILRHFDLEKTPAYRKCRVAFAVLFFMFRLAWGFPQVVRWYADMYAVASGPAQRMHSPAVFFVSLCLPAPFMCVQLWWFRAIARAALRKGKE